MLDEFIAGLAVLLTGGIVTYFIKPSLDAWLDRKQERQRLLAASQRESERAARVQSASFATLDAYKDKLIRELKDLRILDMARPLDLEHTYVQIAIEEERSRRYPDRDDLADATRPDPNLDLDLQQERLAEDRGQTFTPAEALRQFRHLVVLGDPGAGKTTMLKYVCLMSAKGKAKALPDFPIFVSLNRFAKERDADLLDFISREASDRYGLTGGRPFIEGCLDQGGAIVLLDGLDEASVGSAEAADEAYRHTVAEINKLSTRFPKAPVVVTSRRAGWKGQLAPTFTIAAVLDFTANDIRQFIENWFGAKSDRARDLQLRLSEQVQLQELAANPLLLSLIAIVFEQDLELPERRAKLYERCVHVLLTEWDAHRGIKRQSLFTADRKRDLLEDVALHFHRQGQRYFAKASLLDVIRSYLPTIDLEARQAEAILDEITSQHGLLKEQAIDWYGFLHLTLQEYFSALSIDRASQTHVALAHADNPWWEEVILLLAGMSKDASPLLEAILGGQDDIFHSRQILAGRCLAGTPRISKPALRQQVGDRLRAMIRNETIHWLPRAHAVRALQEAEGHHGAQLLLDVVADRSVRMDVRIAAVEALTWAAARWVPERLTDIMADETQDLQLREWIGSASLQFGRPELIPRFIRIMKDEAIVSEVRAECARALGQWGDERAVEALFHVLVHSNDGHIGWRAARALAALGAFADPDHLRATLDDPRVHRTAAWALGKAAVHLEPQHFPNVLEWVADESLTPEIRWNLAKGMGRNPLEAEVHAGLQDLFHRKQTFPSLRATIGISLLLLGDDVAADLKHALDDDNVDAYVKKKAAEVLLECGERDISSSLLTVLKADLPPESSFVRLRMAELIANIGDPSIAPALFSALGEDAMPPHIRQRVADALSTFDVTPFVDGLTAMALDDQHPLVVRKASVLCLAGAPDAVDRLMAWLDRPDVGDAAYAALYRAARRQGVRIMAHADGGYFIESRPS